MSSEAKNKKIHYGWWIMVSCCAFYGGTIGILGNTMGLFLQPVMQEMSWTRTEASYYMSIMPLVAALIQPLAANLFKKYSIRMVLGLAIILFSGSYIATSRFNTLLSWNIYGVLYGVSAGFLMYLPVPLLINNWFKKRVGIAMGIALAFVNISGAVFNPIASNLIADMGWRDARVVLGIVSLLISLPLAVLLVRYKPEELKMKPYGFDDNASNSQTANAAPSGISFKQAVKTVPFYSSILLAGLFVLCASMMQQVPGYAGSIGLDPATGASAVSIVMAGSIIGKIGLGYINDKFGTMVTAFLACALGASGALIVLLAGSNAAFFLIGTAFFGLGYAALTIIPPLVVRTVFGQKSYGEIYSMITLGLGFFSAASPLIYARIFDATQSFQIAWLLVLCAYIAGCVLVPVIMKLGKNLKTSWE